MARDPNVRECRDSGAWLCKAPGGLRARISRPSSLRCSAALSASEGLPGSDCSPSAPQRHRLGGTDRRLADAGGGPGPVASPTCSGSADACAPANHGRGSLSSAAADRGGDSGRSGSAVCLDSRLLVLEPHLGVGRRPLGSASPANGGLGWGPLVSPGARLGVDWRRLALVVCLTVEVLQPRSRGHPA